MKLNNEIYEEIRLYHSSKAQKKYIANRKEYPQGMLHVKYKHYSQVGKGSKETKKKVKK